MKKIDDSKAKSFYRACIEDDALTGWICSFVSVSLMIAGFCLPPVGVIDNSVIVGVGELFGFYAVSKVPTMIRSIRDGKTLSVKHGDTEVNVSSASDEK